MRVIQAEPVFGAVDDEVEGLLRMEGRRQLETFSLVASENHVSSAVLRATGSVLANKYSEGYPGRRYYEGQQVIDLVESLAASRARSLFGADHANVQPYSGSSASLAIYQALTQPGDTIMGMGVPMGGHLSHGWNVSVSGQWFRAVQYGVRRDTGQADLDEVRQIALRERPKILFCGGAAIPRAVDFAGFASIAAESGAVLVASIAHIAGLIAGGVHPSPVGHAPVITTTTHKSLRGPRGGMILCDSQYATPVDRAVFPGLQGGPHNNTTAGIAVCLHEAAQPEFREYAQRVVDNARALAAELLALGYDLVSGGTDTHLILIDLTRSEVAGKPVARALDRAGITANYNTVPFDPRKPLDPSGVRLGTPAITTRGLQPSDMPLLATWFHQVVQAVRAGRADDLTVIAGQVRELALQYPPPGVTQQEAPSLA
ncbi:MAG TPA: serine hydroxymethyltransferase [Trebonia sp.]|nr:serine hydroxymethyltransferase [Trebonia sp.]